MATKKAKRKTTAAKKTAPKRKKASPKRARRTAKATRKKPAKGSKGGRPRIEIDWDNVARLLRVGNTNEDIAAILEISIATLQARFAEHPEKVEAARATRRSNLRTRQTANALAGSDRMLIHLGEHELGQRRKLQLSGEPGQPPVAFTVAEFVQLGAARQKQRLAIEAESSDGGE